MTEKVGGQTEERVYRSISELRERFFPEEIQKEQKQARMNDPKKAGAYIAEQTMKKFRERLRP